MEGGAHSREPRALVAGAVCGALLRIHASLTRLDVRTCPLGIDGAKAIGGALRCNGSIASLSLLDDQLGDEGIEHIAEAIRANAEESAITALNAALLDHKRAFCPHGFNASKTFRLQDV